MASGPPWDRQWELLVALAEMPRLPARVFYERLRAELVTAGFDIFAVGQCAPYFAAGWPSLPPVAPSACCWSVTRRD
jgi:hypothetical protein